MRAIAFGMADEGGGVAVLGRNVDLLVDHGVSVRSRFPGFLAVVQYDYKETGS